MRMDFLKYINYPKPSINYLLVINLTLAVVLMSISLMVELASEPPVLYFERARKAVARARDCQANIYATDLLIAAELDFNQAQLAWMRENQRWMINREYYRTREYSIKALKAADHAALRALAVRDSLRWLAQTGIQLLKKQIVLVRPHLIDMPIQRELRQKIAWGELLTMESEAAFKRGDYRRA
ncbi:hypothetical protein JXO59_10570, partial [candidate division KSB1 bacterium]|nr:hypothetical protein [candidate division KSB1 bacterium]